MKSTFALVVLLGCGAAVVSAQQPSSSFDRGKSQQSWQNAGYKAALRKCKNPPQPFAIPRAGQGANTTAPPPEPALPAPAAIPGVLAAGQSWKVVWSWEGNNVDGPIAAANGMVLFANNDAGNVMQLDPSTGLAKVAYRDINTAGAVSRSKNGALFVAERGLGSGIEQLEPQRKMLADSFRGEPLDCVGGVVNDLVADARGGVYFSVTGAADSGVFYADAFDVKPDGSLTDQREFGKLQGGQGGDGSAVDQQGRLYVATGASVDVFAPDGKLLGSIAGPPGLHGTFFGGRDKKTLFGIVFYGTWGTPSARNKIIAIPLITEGYKGRAK